jgi:hypothetical protein
VVAIKTSLAFDSDGKPEGFQQRTAVVGGQGSVVGWLFESYFIFLSFIAIDENMARTRKPVPQLVRLNRRKKAILDALPPFSEVLRGSFFERTVRCGKRSCRCATGPGHPVACVGVTYADGRTEQVTVPRQLVPAVRRWVANYQRWWRAIERMSAINRRLLRLRLLPASSTPVGKAR